MPPLLLLLLLLLSVAATAAPTCSPTSTLECSSTPIALLSQLSGAESVAPSPTCPSTSTFECPSTPSALLSASWCSASNPLVFPQPPAVLATSEIIAAQCLNASDPFSPCTLIVRFEAGEVIGLNGTPVKLLTISEVSPSGSSLSIFDEHLTLLDTPVAGFPGRLSLLGTAPGPPLSSNPGNASLLPTTLVGYGGTFDAGGVLLSFEVFNTSMSVGDGFFDPARAFISAGLFEYANATAHGFEFFTATLNATAAAAAGLPPGESTFAALTLLLDSGGVVVVFYALLPEASPVCLNPSALSPCFVVVGSWSLLKDGAPPAAPVQVHVADAWSQCTQPPQPAQALALAYSPFYTSQHCSQRTTLVLVSSGSTVSTLAFALPASALEPVLVDLSQGTSVRAFDAALAGAPPGAALVADFAVLTSVVLAAPNVSAGAGAGPVAAPPSSLWLLVATSAPPPPPGSTPAQGGASPHATLFAIALPAFSLERSPGAVAPGNPAGSPVQCPGWGAFWNGTACATSPVVTVYKDLDVGATALATAWRALPAAQAAPLIAGGCLWWNASCVAEVVQEALGVEGSEAAALPLAAGATAAAAAAAAQQWRERLAAGTPLDDLVAELIAAVSGGRFVVPVALTSRQIAVLQFTPLPPCVADASGLGAAVSLDNALELGGEVSSLDVTPNGQYIVASTSRPQFALASMERAVAICAALAAAPSDPFLVEYASMCSSSGSGGTPPPRRPATADFLLVATACLPGSLCPSFTQELALPVPAGHYTTLGFTPLPCAPGTYCQGGRAIACPPGFQCPSPAMALPLPCGYDSSLTTTCSSPGTVAPAPCPAGALCAAPYLPPLPAPPGYATLTSVTPFPDGSPGNFTFRGLQLCAAGQWCGFGRAEPEAGGSSSSSSSSSLACPAGAFCAAPSTLEPVPCNFGGACNASACPVMPCCPPGSAQEAPCPAGFYCLNTSAATLCAPGTWCPLGSSLWALCPLRSYCPTPAQRLQCPTAHYCPEGVIAPVPCSWLEQCYCEGAGGCAAPPVSLAVVAFGPSALAAAALYLALRSKRARAACRGWAAAAGAAVAGKGRQRAQQQAEDGDTPLLAGDSASLNVAEGAIPISASSAQAPAPPPLPPLPPRSTRLAVAFADLSVTLPSGVRVLSSVSGRLRAGRVTAIMGPSGAGKTTLLSALSGKAAAYGLVQGTLTLNGAPGALWDASVRHLVGFVPQEDVMLRDESVGDTVHFAAATRLPAALAPAAKRAHAQAVLATLGLAELQGCAIGDELTRGISGGQRKRVNIGIEMASDPVVLLLDEPTSGLDAAASLEVCSALRSIAAAGTTVALVLHQPRWEIFSQFDDLLLLAKGGRLAYCGPVAGALPHFEGVLGRSLPPMVNPADFIVDVVGAHAQQCADAWVAVQQAAQGGEKEEEEGGSSASGLPLSLPPRDPLPMLTLAWHFAVRSLRQQAASPGTALVNNAFVCVAAFFLAWIYFGDPSYAPPAPLQTYAGCAPPIAAAAQTCLAEAQDDLINRGIMAVIVVSLTGVATFLRTLGAERAVCFGEAAALPQPSASVAYFLGKDAACLPQVALGALVFTVAYNALIVSRAPFAAYYAVFLGVNWCASALGHLTAVLAPPALSQLVGVVSVFAFAQFAGGAPTLLALQAKAPPLCWLPATSFARYALEALYVAEVKEYSAEVALQGVDLRALVKSTFDYNLDAFALDVGVVFALGAALRLAALAALVLGDRARKM